MEIMPNTVSSTALNATHLPKSTAMRVLQALLIVLVLEVRGALDFTALGEWRSALRLVVSSVICNVVR